MMRKPHSFPCWSFGRRLLGRWGFAALAGLALLATVAAPARAQGLRLTGLGGESLTDADLAQGTTIVIVWTSWSPHSQGLVDRVNPIAQRWKSQARVVTVNYQEDRGAIEQFLAGKSFGAPVLIDADGSFSKRYNVVNLPGLLVFKDGSVAYRGKLPDNPDKVIVEILG